MEKLLHGRRCAEETSAEEAELHDMEEFAGVVDDGRIVEADTSRKATESSSQRSNPEGINPARNEARANPRW